MLRWPPRLLAPCTSPIPDRGCSRATRVRPVCTLAIFQPHPTGRSDRAIGFRRRRPLTTADDAGRGGAVDTRERPGAATRATGTAAGAAGSGLLLIARIIRAVTFAVVAIIVAAILVRVLGANQSNELVSTITDWGRWLAGPFKDLFSFDSEKTTVAVNWGLAALVYLVVGMFIARLFARGAGAGFRARDRRAAY